MSVRVDPKLPIAPVAGDDPAVPLMKPDRYFDRLVRRLNELFRTFGDGTIALLDEGTYLGQASGLNFVGTDVTATLGTDGTGVVTVSGGSGITSPLTTKGDVWGYSTTDARIPIGSNGQVLTADSTQTLGLKWATPSGGSSGLFWALVMGGN